ncbi:MAG: hypothetical protein HYZ37_17805 [Candidatus Solibacter usitatus]|nr:hypothetical protein [Candidatus Solibacter usitatus]
MPETQYENAKATIQSLPPSDQLRLVAEVITHLAGSIHDSPRPTRSLLELQGLGKEIWQNIDVDEYLREERASWDR